MQDTFPTALKHVLLYEGGYVNHPLDPGGATNMGITHKTLSRYRGAKVTRADVRNLTFEEASNIYRKFYWHPCCCDLMPAGLDIALFDCAVNQGPPRAIRFLQQAVSTKADGAIGPITLAAINRQPPLDILNEFIARRMHHYGRLSTLFKTFGLGWSRRLSDVHSKSLIEINQKEIPHELHS